MRSRLARRLRAFGLRLLGPYALAYLARYADWALRAWE